MYESYLYKQTSPFTAQQRSTEQCITLQLFTHPQSGIVFLKLLFLI